MEERYLHPQDKDILVHMISQKIKFIYNSRPNLEWADVAARNIWKMLKDQGIIGGLNSSYNYKSE